MTVILDVSAAIEILLKKEKKALFEKSYQEASWVIAPDLFVSEITNVLWKCYKAKLVSHEECVQYVEDGISLVDDFVDCRELWKEALGEGIKCNHFIYDMFYLVLSRRNDARLITNDARLSELCIQSKIDVVF